MKFNFYLLCALPIILGTVLSSCKIETARPAKQKYLTIASDYLRPADTLIFQNFSKRNNIKLKIIHLSPSKMIGQFRKKKFNSGIDVFMLKSMTTVLDFHKKDLLHPLKKDVHFSENEADYSSERFDYIGFGYDPYIVAAPKSSSAGIRMYNDLTRHKFITNLSKDELIPLFAPILSKKDRIGANSWVKKFYEHSKKDSTYTDSIGNQLPMLTTYSSFHAKANKKVFIDKKEVFPNTKSTGTFYNLRTICIAYQAENFDEATTFIHYYFNKKNNNSLNEKLNTIGIDSKGHGFRKYYMNSEKMIPYYLTIERLLYKLEDNN